MECVHHNDEKDGEMNSACKRIIQTQPVQCIVKYANEAAREDRQRAPQSHDHHTAKAMQCIVLACETQYTCPHTRLYLWAPSSLDHINNIVSFPVCPFTLVHDSLLVS
jgi:hypothetical protein